MKKNTNNRAQIKVAFSSKNHRLNNDAYSGKHNQYEQPQRNGRKKNKTNGGHMHQQQISISSESKSKSKQSGLIRFQNQSQRELDENDIIPWISNGTKNIKDSLLRLHNQIIEFYNYVKPSKKAHTAKLKKFSFIKDRITQFFPKAQVIAFGSFATQLYLPDGDVDVAVLTNGHYQPIQVYNKINKYLQQKSNSQLFSNVEYIRKSKVPLIKFEFQGTHFDISVDKQDGISQVKYVQKINKYYPQFKYLTLTLKCALRIRGLADTYTGGIGSFLLSCMILNYLQQAIQKSNYYTLAEHLIEFIKYYALNDEYWKYKVLYVRSGAIMDRNFDGTYFSCISPQDESHDIGRSAFKIKQVFHVLKNRCRYILDKNFSQGESILRVLINPSDQAFRYLKQSKNQ